MRTLPYILLIGVLLSVLPMENFFQTCSLRALCRLIGKWPALETHLPLGTASLRWGTGFPYAAGQQTVPCVISNIAYLVGIYFEGDNHESCCDSDSVSRCHCILYAG